MHIKLKMWLYVGQSTLSLAYGNMDMYICYVQALGSVKCVLSLFCGYKEMCVKFDLHGQVNAR